jgi:hypothetical protein
VQIPLAKIPEGGRFAAAGALHPQACFPVILARVRPDGSPSSLRGALNAGWRELAFYLAAGIVYVAFGVAFPEFLFTWAVAAGYLVVCVALLPVLVRLLRR